MEDKLRESKENELRQIAMMENTENGNVPPESEEMEERYIPTIQLNEDIVMVHPEEIENRVILSTPQETKMVEINVVWYLFTVIYNIFFCVDIGCDKE
jgi:hypothetical protein